VVQTRNTPKKVKRPVVLIKGSNRDLELTPKQESAKLLAEGPLDSPQVSTDDLIVKKI